MPSLVSSNAASSVFKIDRFAVPPPSLPAFIERVRYIDGVLAELPGCKQHQVLIQTAEASESTERINVVTIVEWQDEKALAAAKEIARTKYVQAGFDPKAFMEKLGVRADMGLYSTAVLIGGA
jgi:heme-degrading monooxygenase HmoA